MKFIELFAGVGGFRYGLEKASDKFKIVWANEIDRYACQIYRKNYGGGELYEGDITKVKTDDIPDHDLLCAGFPCQSFSIAGRRRAFLDTRGTLFFEIARICREKKPRYILLENVKGLLSCESGGTFQTILKVLSDIGYILQWQVLNSKNFGVPQNRERVFIIGHLRGTRRPEVFPIGESHQRDIVPQKETQGKRERIRSEVASTLAKRDYKGGNNLIQVHNMQPRSPNRPSLKYSSGGSGHLSREDTAYCLDSGRTNAVEFKDMEIRRLTPTECERLQGFPDGWTEGVSDTQRYKCLGNAVSTPVITEIGKRLI